MLEPTFNRSLGPLTRLLDVSKRACDTIRPLVNELYLCIGNLPAGSKLKDDKSVFTIADGLVQELLQGCLFHERGFENIVGEEDDANVNISSRPYSVDELQVPDHLNELLEHAKQQMLVLRQEIDDPAYADCTIFIDPIDGTREFYTKKGGECTILIGVARQDVPVAGLVYRPLVDPVTWVAGCKHEGCAVGLLDAPETPNPQGLMVTNGTVSPFMKEFVAELRYEFVRAGGAGNKLLCMIEGKGSCYISDRGVSRWDTCAPQAVIESLGGTLSQLAPFIEWKTLQSYHYRKTDINLDCTPGKSWVTPYNARDKSKLDGAEHVRLADPLDITPYSNVCGLLALNKDSLGQLDALHQSMLNAATRASPHFD